MVSPLKSNTVIDEIVSGLSRDYPDEPFLREEIEEVFQGLINSLRWAALRHARAGAESGGLFKLNRLVTSDHFSTSLLTRDEIVNRVANTSGLDTEISSSILAVLDSLIDDQLARYGSLDMEYVGTITKDSDKGYAIELSSDLRIAPGMDMGRGLAAY
ncbi:MAG: hypothetical protein ACRD9S_01885 [Pyrinomonadaceae bacterium]